MNAGCHETAAAYLMKLVSWWCVREDDMVYEVCNIVYVWWYLKLCLTCAGMF